MLVNGATGDLYRQQWTWSSLVQVIQVKLVAWVDIAHEQTVLNTDKIQLCYILKYVEKVDYLGLALLTLS